MAKDKFTHLDVVVNPFDEAVKLTPRPTLTNVRFLQNAAPYVVGECAGLEPTIAEHYVKFGVAALVFEHGGKLYTVAEKQEADAQRAREDAPRAPLASVSK
jgi:hypothetical protein